MGGFLLGLWKRKEKMRQSKESYARIRINQYLQDAGWDIQNQSQVITEDKSGDGYADYVLNDSKGRPLAVIEAKREEIDPRTADAQAQKYAKSKGVDFIFLSNGNEHYFWDNTESATPRKIKTFYTPQDLAKKRDLKTIQRPPSTIPVNQDIAGGNGRQYQIDCIDALTNAYEQGQRGMLVEMATGMGKTRTAAAFIARMLESNHAHRVLFLVDRKTLAKQTRGEFVNLLSDNYTTQYVTARFDTAHHISVATLQTLQNQFLEMPSSYFDLIIIDECHRSIYGKWRGILDHFDAVRVGLTATPCLGNVDGTETDEFVKDSFKFFEITAPTYSYGMKDGIQDNFLNGYKIFRAETVKTTGQDGLITLSKQDIDFTKINDFKVKEAIEDIFGCEQQAQFPVSSLERLINIPERNRKIVQEFRKIQENGYCTVQGNRIIPKQHDDGGVEKTIVFAVTKRHAMELADYFDKAFADQKKNPTDRIADFVVSGDEHTRDRAENVIERFKEYENPLRIIVSVGMLDTGFDCPEVCNLVFARFTESEILYRQMRGRGCRLSPSTHKEQFFIYDFVGVTDYFGDNDDNPTGGAVVVSKPKPDDTTPKSQILLTFHNADDWIAPDSRAIIETDEHGKIVEIDTVIQQIQENTEHARMVQNIAHGNYTMDESKTLRQIINQIIRNGCTDKFSPAHLSLFGLDKNATLTKFNGEESFMTAIKTILTRGKD